MKTIGILVAIILLWSVPALAGKKLQWLSGIGAGLQAGSEVLGEQRQQEEVLEHQMMMQEKAHEHQMMMQEKAAHERMLQEREHPQQSAEARYFETYDDCILFSLKGVQSDVAAKAIKRSCRNMIDSQEAEKAKRQQEKKQQAAKAAQEFRDTKQSAEQGDAVAQTNLGAMYEHGNGVPQDYEEAARWYRKAAEQGDEWAQTNLGWMYEKGRGVPQDKKEAARWYTRARGMTMQPR